MHSKISFLFLDAKVIKIGGIGSIKTPKPQPRTTRTPKPKPITLRPTIPWIVPLPIILPGFGRNSYVNKNSSKFDNCVKAHITQSFKNHITFILNNGVNGSIEPVTPVLLLLTILKDESHLNIVLFAVKSRTAVLLVRRQRQ